MYYSQHVNYAKCPNCSEQLLLEAQVLALVYQLAQLFD